MPLYSTNAHLTVRTFNRLRIGGSLSTGTICTSVRVGMPHPPATRIYSGCYSDWVQTLVTTIKCRLGQSNESHWHTFCRLETNQNFVPSSFSGGLLNQETRQCMIVKLRLQILTHLLSLPANALCAVGQVRNFQWQAEGKSNGMMHAAQNVEVLRDTG